MGPGVRKRYGRKVDANQKEIVNALKKTGRNVFEIEEPFDLLIDNYGEWVVMEIKNPETNARQKGGGLMTDKQLKIMAELKAPVVVAYDIDMALNALARRY